jgi:hypothetical protein
MKTNKRFISLLAVILPALALLLSGVLVLSARAQGPLPPERADIQAPDATSNYIPFQGRLTDTAGNPLDGTYNVTFRIYDVSSGGTALCSDTNSVSVTAGLFSTYVDATDCADEIDGRQLYLGIEVETDGEMTPRAYIDNVPYAWSLRPGANVESNIDDPLLYLYNTGSGEGLWGTSVYGEGVHGASGDGSGVGAYSLLGAGLYANSLNGVAIAAGGTGIITSTAPTYLWISGSGVQPYSSNDSTVITMDTTGGAFIERGADAGIKYVMLPVTIPGVLYGQNVTISAIDIYFVVETEFDGITDVRVRLQDGGVCPTCYLDLLHDSADHGCEIGVEPNGCTLHYDLTANNVLSPDSGALHIGLGFNFSGASTYVDIGGVRLTLEYDD